MTASLTTDNNANTLADAGDPITYTTAITNPDDGLDAASTGTQFTLTPAPDSSLVTGSVTTTQGTVTTGNGGGDTAAAVNVGTIADGASTTVGVTVTVAAAPNSPLSAQGTVTSDSLTALRTDDPGVAGTSDPTQTPVVEGVPELSPSPATLAFGSSDIAAGPTAGQTSTVTNSGTTAVTLSGLTLTGDTTQFERLTGQPADCTATTALAPAATCGLRPATCACASPRRRPAPRPRR